MADLVESIEDILRRERGSILRGRRGATLTGAKALEFYRRISAVYGVGRSAIPLGTPISLADVTEPEVAGLSQVVSGSTGISTGSVFGLPGTSRRVTTTPDQAVLSTQQTTQEEAMDLGSIVTTLGSQYIEARFGQPRTPTTRPVMNYQVPVGTGVDVYGVNPSLAFLPALPGAVAAAGSLTSKIAGGIAGLGLGLAADEIAAIAGVASKVKCRRRRRRLATHSDIKDLAALKAVLGSGKAFDTWIATRKM